MTSKAEQLFLELCLLRLRYTEEDIWQVAQVREVQENPTLRSLMGALRELELGRPSLKDRRLKSPKSKGPGLPVIRYPLDLRAAISAFVRRITEKKILRTREQLENFARSIGLSETHNDRQHFADAVREKLESMVPLQAARKMASADAGYGSDSSPYMDLAKTLMRS